MYWTEKAWWRNWQIRLPCQVLRCIGCIPVCSTSTSFERNSKYCSICPSVSIWKMSKVTNYLSVVFSPLHLEKNPFITYVPFGTRGGPNCILIIQTVICSQKSFKSREVDKLLLVVKSKNIFHSLKILCLSSFCWHSWLKKLLFLKQVLLHFRILIGFQKH